MTVNIADIRKNYSHKKLSEKKADANPMKQFAKWWKQAAASKIDEVNAMTLATASQDGVPAARIVLLKGVDENGFIFFTNYESFKGQQLIENPKACLVFFWKELERQVRITGLVEKISAAASDEYFYSRPEDSQLGAIASPQSRIIENREWLDKHFKNEKMVSGYAGMLMVTPNYLNEIIKKTTGFSAGYHIRQRVVLEAKRLAKYSNMCMKEIAYSLDFADSAHFSKFFKTVTGTNFSDYKKEKFILSIAN